MGDEARVTMAITRAKPIDPTAVKRPPIEVCDAIVRRYLKPDQNIAWSREMPTFTRLYKRYPSVAFWQAYELPFGNGTLNMMTWFESVEGVEELKRAWLLFHYTPPASEDPPSTPQVAPQEQTQSAVDTTPQPPYTAPRPSRPKTVAAFLTQP